MPPTSETIAAVATPPGRGGISVVRIAGADVPVIATAVLGTLPKPRRAVLAKFHDHDGSELDRGIAIYFPAPHSYTGDDVLELQGHGGPMVMDMLLRRVLALGARMARPGEFSERAFLNGKLDLAQAEAVADLIDSGSEAAARSALRSLEGEFSNRVHTLVDGVTGLRTFVEAAIDFPEEEVDFLDDRNIDQRLQSIIVDLDTLLASACQGRLLRDGLQVALLGRPNAGKSSVLNALTGSDRAIVSAHPGTTRDTIEQSVNIDGLPIHLTDTAGLRRSDDAVEREGVMRARTTMGKADLVLLIIDDSERTNTEEIYSELAAEIPVTVVFNKIDLSGRDPGPASALIKDQTAVAVSALTGAGMSALRAHLKQCAGYQDSSASTFSARRRHLDALTRARTHLQAAQQQLAAARAGEIVAEELRLAQQYLGEITGEVTADDLLGRIFSTFCIGK